MFAAVVIVVGVAVTSAMQDKIVTLLLLTE